LKYILIVLLFLIVALIQASVLPAFPVFGVIPNLVLVLAVCWTVARGQQEAMVVVPLAGVCLGLVGDHPLGITLLATVPIVLLADIEVLRFARSEFVLTVVLVFFSTMIYELVLLVALRLQGGSVSWFAAFLRVVVPVGLASVLFTPPVYWLVRRRSAGPKRIRAFV
jgi:rod shape-determining protein MreD